MTPGVPVVSTHLIPATVATVVPTAATVRVWVVGPGARPCVPVLREYLQTQGLDPLDVVQIEAKAEEVPAVCEGLRTMPLIGTLRGAVVTVRGDVPLSTLARPLRRLPPTSRLLLLVDKAPTRGVPKRLAGVAALLPPLTTDDLLRHLQAEAAQAGHRMTGEAARQLLDRYPAPLRLATETFKVATVAPRVVIAPSDLGARESAADPYHVLLAAARGSVEHVLAEAAPALLGEDGGRGLVRQLAKLVRAYFLLVWAAPDDLGAVRALRLPFDQVSTWRCRAEAFSLPRLRHWVRVLSLAAQTRESAVEVLSRLAMSPCPTSPHDPLV